MVIRSIVLVTKCSLASFYAVIEVRIFIPVFRCNFQRFSSKCWAQEISHCLFSKENAVQVHFRVLKWQKREEVFRYFVMLPETFGAVVEIRNTLVSILHEHSILQYSFQ